MELRDSGITDNKTLSAIETTPREKFISSFLKDQAYENIALPIEKSQTISQPFIVALMTQNIELEKKHKVLELGTGSGYQTVILSKLSRRVYTVERIRSLLINAQKIFFDLKINNIVSKVGDGNKGWIEQKPFDRIIITAATSALSDNIKSQIKEGGIIIVPIKVDDNIQILRKVTLRNNKLIEKDISQVTFVPNLSGVKD